MIALFAPNFSASVTPMRKQTFIVRLETPGKERQRERREKDKGKENVFE